MIEASKLICERADRLRAGVIAWIDDIEGPVFVLAGPEPRDGDERIVLLMDLGGERPFEIWDAGNVAGRAALVLTEFRLELHVESRERLSSITHRKGHAFVTDANRGLIGTLSRGRGRLGDTEAFDMNGEHCQIPHDARAFTFSKWRLVTGQPDRPQVIFDSIAADTSIAPG